MERGRVKNGLLTLVFSVLVMSLFSGCSKEPVELESAQVVSNLDKGSGNFDRVLQICFKQPLSDTYYHKVVILTKESVKITGEGTLRPLASDPDNKCQLRNIYTYIHKDSPIGARELIKDYVVPGNIRQILVQIYDSKPEGKERPISERVFKDL
ncbi:hypothetical protein [Thiomicrorhabdus chilensis]|uniref:hypothetical protein n=1 Tax=Thiomicrorhabdus chilensis TaxID=63656 RepID=UPI000405B9DE|nr:hypothetical protein [Thiomicrorhabdus chilensis]